MRDGAFVAVTSDLPLIAGDRLRTAAGGSAMIVMVDHTVVFVSEESELEMSGPQRLRMLRGHAVAMVEDWPRVLAMPAPANGALLAIDVPGGEITGMAAGDYEIDIESRPEGAASTVMFVHGGRARVAGLMSSVANPGFERPESYDPRRSLDVSKGQSALLRGSEGRSSEGPWAIAPSRNPHRRVPEALRSSLTSLRGFRERAPVMYANLPPALHLHAWLLGTEGSWVTDPQLGRYWMPHVENGWQPFTNGSWTYLGAFGWTWTSSDRFWGWVAWANAPDYVAWCPLGWDDRAVFDFTSDYWYDGVRADGRRLSWSYSRRHRDVRVVRPEHGRRPLPSTPPVFAYQPSRHGGAPPASPRRPSPSPGPGIPPAPGPAPAPAPEDPVAPVAPIVDGHVGAVPRSSLSPAASTGAVPRVTDPGGGTGAVPRVVVPNGATTPRTPALGEVAVPRVPESSNGSAAGAGAVPRSTPSNVATNPRASAPSSGVAVPRHGSLDAAAGEAARAREAQSAREAQAAQDAQAARETAEAEARTRRAREAAPSNTGAVPRNEALVSRPRRT